MNPLRAIPVATLLAAAALLAGCGDDEETTVTVQETVEDTTTEETTAGEEIGTATAVVTDVAPGGTQGPKYFQSPSGNIGCYIDTKHARCDIRERDWKPTPPTQPCELDYGRGIVLSATHAEFVCAGDTTLGGPKTLDYGENAQRGSFVCHSQEAGISCSHAGNGHGFFLSREMYRLF